MDTAEVKAVLQWMKGTDIVELAYRKAGRGFALSSTEAPPAVPAGAMPPARFVPVASESVGVFQWSLPGQARRAHEGDPVAEGDVLGVVVTGSGEARAVKAPRAGRLAKVFADAGEGVEYGRPLFLLEP